MRTLCMKLIRFSVSFGLPMLMLTGVLAQCGNIKTSQPTQVNYPQYDDGLDDDNGFGDDEEDDDEEGDDEEGDDGEDHGGDKDRN